MVGLELPGQGARWRAVTTPAHAAPGTYAHFKTFPGRGTLGRHGPKAQPQAMPPRVLLSVAWFSGTPGL